MEVTSSVRCLQGRNSDDVCWQALPSESLSTAKTLGSAAFVVVDKERRQLSIHADMMG